MAFNAEVTCGGLTVIVPRPGNDNPGQRKQAARDVADSMGVAIDQGVHMLVTVDAADGDTDYYEVPRGQANGTWHEEKTTRVRPSQVAMPESGIVVRPGAAPKKEAKAK